MKMGIILIALWIAAGLALQLDRKTEVKFDRDGITVSASNALGRNRVQYSWEQLWVIHGEQHQ